MNARLKNTLLIAAVAMLTILPLLTVNKTTAGPDGKPAEMFKGSDNQAKGVIQSIAPDYKPWFSSIMNPSSSEIESLLFALQAAIGAGFIGYYVGYSRGRAKQNTTQSAIKRAH